MAVGELVEAILSVEFMFGATAALAFRKQVGKLLKSVFQRADDAVEGDKKGG